MPLYEYRCTTCGGVKEELRPISERDQVARCVICGCVAMRIISVFTVILKGNPGESVSNNQSFDKSDKYKYEGGAGIRIGGGGKNINIKDCHFSNMRAVVSMSKGTDISLNGITTDNVTNVVEITDD